MKGSATITCLVKAELRRDENGVVWLDTFMKTGKSGDWKPLLDPATLDSLSDDARRYYEKKANKVSVGESLPVRLPPSESARGAIADLRRFVFGGTLAVFAFAVAAMFTASSLVSDKILSLLVILFFIAAFCKGVYDAYRGFTG